MTKTCIFKDQDGVNICDKQIDEKYLFCAAHSAEIRAKKAAAQARTETPPALNPEPKAARSPQQWHEDPLVDQLMKLGANMGRAVQHLENLNDTLERIADALEANGNAKAASKPVKKVSKALKTDDDFLDDTEDA